MEKVKVTREAAFEFAHRCADQARNRRSREGWLNAYEERYDFSEANPWVLVRLRRIARIFRKRNMKEGRR